MANKPKTSVDFTDLVDSLDSQNKQAAETATAQSDRRSALISNIRTRQAITDGLDSLARVLTAHEPNVVVKNFPKPVTSIDVPHLEEVVTNLQQLVKLESAEDYGPVTKALDRLQTAVEALPAKIVIPESKKVESVSVDNQIDYSAKFDSLESAIKAVNVKPQVDVKPQVKVTNNLTELENVTQAVKDVITAVNTIKIPEAPKVDTASIKDAVDKVYDAISNLSFPVPNYVLPFKNAAGQAVQVTLNSDGTLPITSGGSGSSTTPVYKTMFDFDSAGTYIYKGESVAGTALSSPLWRISKTNFDTSGNPTNILWADGVSTFTKAWSSHTSYGYTA